MYRYDYHYAHYTQICMNNFTELQVLTFATDENTSGLQRYLQSANHFGLDVKVLKTSVY